MEQLIVGIAVFTGIITLGVGIGIGIGIALGMEIVMRVSGDGRTVMLTWARTRRDDQP